MASATTIILMHSEIPGSAVSGYQEDGHIARDARYYNNCVTFMNTHGFFL
jgi:hypothetical protein